MVFLPSGTSVRLLYSDLDFINAVSKLYILEDAKEHDKLKLVKLYEELVVNCFQVRIFD